MVSVSLITLKNGLKQLKDATRQRQDALNARLARSETLSSDEEHWLDNMANHVDEQALIPICFSKLVVIHTGPRAQKRLL